MAAKWGRAIRLQRQSLKKTQTWLADEVGVTQGAIAQWEKGLCAPSPDHQLAIGDALGVDARVLFTFPQREAVA